MKKRLAKLLIVVMILTSTSFSLLPKVYAYSGTPYVAHNLPCVIQAEDFDNGGANVAYYDTSPTNLGGVYRTNYDVDIAAITGGYCVGWGEDGEWMRYTVNNASYGRYKFTLRAASAYPEMAIRLNVDGVDYGPYPVPGLGNLAFTDVEGPVVALAPGSHLVTVFINSIAAGNCLNIDYMNVTLQDTEMKGYVITYEAESGTLGGSPAPQISNVYKNYTGSGFVAWWGSEGQYDDITVNVPVAAKYKLTYKYSAPASAGRSIYVNGARIIDNLNFEQTVNWKSWWTVSFVADLNAGSNTIRCIYESARGSANYLNLDNLKLEYLGNKSYNGQHNIPGRVEAEDFDDGISGLAYYDTTTGNAGNTYRTNVNVDIANVGTEGNVVGWMAGQEWLRYTVYVSETKNYNMTLRVDSVTMGNKVGIYVDEKAVGEYSLPKTGDSWGTYTTMNGPQKLLLTKGFHVIMLKVAAGNLSYNINWFELSSAFAITPGIHSSTLGAEDVICYTVKVTDYGAVPDSDTDATAAFQNALDTVEALGGGVVLAPAGKYRINGHLRIGCNVTLRGEWKNPNDSGLGVGTILKAYENKGNEGGSPFISMARSSGLTHIGIWYPEQSYSNIQAFPYTIQGCGSEQDVITVENVTLYNSYNGLRLGQYSMWNWINKYKNIYGTVLKSGITQNYTSDVARFENINFGISYWANSGLPGAPSDTTSQNTLKTYTRANLTGMHFYRVDWCWMYQINLSDMLYGIHTSVGTNGGTNLGASYLNISNVNVGIKADYLIDAGMQISYSTIHASVGSQPVGILVGSPNTGVNISASTLGGTPHTAIKVTGTNAVVNCNNVTFSDWGYDGGAYAIDSQAGAVSIQKCTFGQNKSHIRLTSGNTGGAILSNAFTGSPQITNSSSGSVVINHNSLNIPTQPSYSYTFPQKRKPSNTSNFYNVRNSPYNAAGNGVADDTTAIQNALTAAGNAGGGIVYLPSGKYRINSYLTVPSGVELRGVFDTVHHGMENFYKDFENSGTQICAYGGKDNAAYNPLISLSANAGLRGVTIFYPEQDFDYVHAYPWTVRGLGDGCWVMNVNFVNPYYGIDMITYRCNNQLVSGNTGGALNTMVMVGSGVTSGYLEDNHFNPTTWVFAKRPGTPVGDYAGDLFDNYLLNASKGFAFGACSSGFKNFQNFSILTLVSVHIFSQPEGTYNGTIYCPGLDATKTGFKVDQAGSVDVMHIMASCAYSDSVGVINTAGTFTGTLNLYNWASWVPNSLAARIDGGTVNNILYNATHSKNFKVNSGTANIYSAVFTHNGIPTSTNDLEFGSGTTSATVMGCLGKSSLNITNNAGSRLVQSNNATY